MLTKAKSTNKGPNTKSIRWGILELLTGSASPLFLALGIGPLPLKAGYFAFLLAKQEEILDDRFKTR